MNVLEEVGGAVESFEIIFGGCVEGVIEGDADPFNEICIFVSQFFDSISLIIVNLILNKD